MSDPAVTRFRLEVIGSYRNWVIDRLLEEARAIRDRCGGEWEAEEGDPEIQSTKTGYWGRITLRRKDAQSDPVSEG